jgi:cytochrome c556
VIFTAPDCVCSKQQAVNNLKEITMKTITQICMLAIGMALTLPSFAAKDPNLKLLKARQGEMQLRSFNAGPLFGMAKGQVDYDAELASTLAGNLKTQLSLQMGRAWKGGTGNDAYPGKTTALPKIWATYPEISEYGKKYAAAVNDLAAAAGNGLDALKPKVSALGKTC